MRTKKFYIQLFSIHGLIRANNLELGRNADTGGQVIYVLELAKALGKHPDVKKVDLFTRLIREKTVSPQYSQPIESVDKKVRIVRIQCGGTKYIRKELLWPHLDEFVDKTLKFVKDEGDIPDIVHGHYPDAGYVANELASFWGIPFVYTAHSLGRVKMHDLSEKGFSVERMNKQFQIDYRIKIEENIISQADLIITSTQQEINSQYKLYQASNSAHFCVLPPGIDTYRFFPFYDEYPPDEMDEKIQIKQAQFYMQKDLERFLSNPEKPLILALSRPDQRKNISGLITAYGTDQELKAIANLAIFAGIRKDISTMDDNEREVLTELLLMMDKYDLYGKLAIPKRHDVEYEVPELYRIAARTQGVFVNPSFKENFGLTLIEAAASGLPIVAANDGGPREIVQNCSNGILVDVSQPEEISGAIKKILVNQELWRTYSQNGIKGVYDNYVWEAHCAKYLAQLNEFPIESKPRASSFKGSKAIGNRFTRIKKLFITDIDDTFIGDDAALSQLLDVLEKNHSWLGFGVATGRHLDSTCEVIKKYNIPDPDLIISSVGTEIYYGSEQMPDNGWKRHISAQWEMNRIKEVLSKLDFLELQEPEAQREFKLSYYMDDFPDTLPEIHHALTQNRLRYNLIFSSGCFLDILPFRASKGKAIRYLSYKWNIPLRNILTAGDSDNDQDMLRGDMLGVIVGNYSKELEKLRGLKNVYFAQAYYAAGILEGFEHYCFLG